jgi:hypothetical protein
MAGFTTPLEQGDNDPKRTLRPIRLIAQGESLLGHSGLGHGAAWAFNKGTNLDVI